MIGIHELVQVAHAFDYEGVNNSTSNGDAVDCRGYTDAMFIIGFGTIAGGAVGAIHVESSPDNSTWTDVPNATATVADSDDHGHKNIRVRCDREDRYLRVVVAETGTATMNTYGKCLLMTGESEPVTQLDTTTNAST